MKLWLGSLAAVAALSASQDLRAHDGSYRPFAYRPAAVAGHLQLLQASDATTNYLPNDHVSYVNPGVYSTSYGQGGHLGGGCGCAGGGACGVDTFALWAGYCGEPRGWGWLRGLCGSGGCGHDCGHGCGPSCAHHCGHGCGHSCGHACGDSCGQACAPACGPRRWFGCFRGFGRGQACGCGEAAGHCSSCEATHGGGEVLSAPVEAQPAEEVAPALPMKAAGLFRRPARPASGPTLFGL